MSDKSMPNTLGFDDAFCSDQFDNVKARPIAVMENCKSEYEKIEAAHEDATYRLIGVLSAVVGAVERSPRYQTQIRQHACWPKNAHPPKEDSLTLTVSRFALRAFETKTAQYERARKYAKVIGYCRSENIDPEDVAGELMRKKISGILRLINKKRNNVDTRASKGSQPSVERRTPQPRSAIVSLPRQETAAETHGQAVDETQIIGGPSEAFGETHRTRNLINRKEERQSVDDDYDSDEVTFFAGSYIRAIDRVNVGSEITVTLRRDPDRNGRYLFRAIHVDREDRAESQNSDETRARRQGESVGRRGPPRLPRIANTLNSVEANVSSTRAGGPSKRPAPGRMRAGQRG